MFILPKFVVIAAQVNMLVFHKNKEENLYSMMYAMIFHLLISAVRSMKSIKHLVSITKDCSTCLDC